MTISLKNYTTFRMGGDAELFLLENHEDVETFFKNEQLFYILGGGSNILVSDKAVTRPFVQYDAKDVFYEEKEDGATVTISSGENWDEFVGETVEKGYGTLANLSLIPGSVGASPVQNIGAYGSEVKESIITVRVYDTNEKKWKEFSNEECQFSYRKSIFQSNKYFLITEVVFSLTKGVNKKPTYGALKTVFEAEETISPKRLREEVIWIRDSKLPRIETLPSVGSFFKNPVVSEEKVEKLKGQFPAIPFFPHENGVKLAAGWLIENAKCEEIIHPPFFLYKKTKLVISHTGGARLEDLLLYVEEIKKKVYEVYGVDLEREPEVIH